eukprot:544942-Hanusia_phi.AAC.2
MSKLNELIGLNQKNFSTLEGDNFTLETDFVNTLKDLEESAIRIETQVTWRGREGGRGGEGQEHHGAEGEGQAGPDREGTDDHGAGEEDRAREGGAGSICAQGRRVGDDPGDEARDSQDAAEVLAADAATGQGRRSAGRAVTQRAGGADGGDGEGDL